ncbi:MAG TPA: dynamin family protein [Actinophytocola sp.]|uniref:dynamin family protein n=1 Tax=Actinophytocola sp. TaxID=1872138 RepID=UPI002DDCDC23|nr:dynamin family protein [Actinophytocola sp.]HEV2782904.1 dynamin family protein [Actinophytocola sp.]
MTALPWLDVLDATIGACVDHHRPDLANRLRQKRSHLLEPTLRVPVVGEPNQGKSQLVNALINAPVCAVGDHVTTPAPIVIGHAHSPVATLVKEPPALDGAAGAQRREPIAVEEIAEQIVARTAAPPSARGELVRTEVGIPRQLLAAGLVLVDTPAVDDLDSIRSASMFAAVSQADAVIVVSAATRELSASELALIEAVSRLCPTVVVVLTKIDIAPLWRRVAERDRARLASAGIQAQVIPVSAMLRLAAARSGDEALNAESGFTDLVSYLQREVIGKPELLARRSVTVLAGMAVQQLLAPLHQTVTATPAAGTSEAIAKWQTAQRQVDQLRKDSAAWQTMLADDMADLAADIEFDLRDRTRRILREVDRFFDEADPLTDWDTFAEWLDESLAEAIDVNFAWLVERFDWITGRIGRDLESYRDDVLPGSLREIDDSLLDTAWQLERPRVERFTLSQKVFVGLRGSYGGLLMFGLATSLAGWPLINAVSLGAGVLFAAKSIYDESGSRLKRRQAIAKATAQHHVDDVFLSFSKDTKDIVRQQQRKLRDHLTATAERLRVEILATAQSAKRAADMDVAEQQSRAAKAKSEIERLTKLHGQITALVPGGVKLPGPRRRLTA